MTRPVIRLGLVDDHPPILRGVIDLLTEMAPGRIVAYAASTVDELIAGTADLTVVLLDIQLNDGSEPVENVTRCTTRGWPVLLYTQETRPAVVARCFRAGAAGIVGKHEDMTVLLGALERVADGEPYLSGAWAAVLEDDAGSATPELTAREREALRYYALGLPMKSVARRMGVAYDTAKEYLMRARRKYADAGRPAGTKTELYLRAVEDGHLPAPGGGGTTTWT